MIAQCRLFSLAVRCEHVQEIVFEPEQVLWDGHGVEHRVRGVVPSAGRALALLSLSYGALTVAGASIWALPGDVAPTPGHVGSISGIQNFAVKTARICISTFVGVMLTRSGGFLITFLVAGGFCLLGAFSYLFIVGEIAPLPARAQREPSLTSPQ